MKKLIISLTLGLLALSLAPTAKAEDEAYYVCQSARDWAVQHCKIVLQSKTNCTTITHCRDVYPSRPRYSCWNEVVCQETYVPVCDAKLPIKGIKLIAVASSTPDKDDPAASSAYDCETVPEKKK